MKVNEIDVLDFYKIYHIITSTKISDTKKVDFIRKHNNQIKEILIKNLSSTDFKTLMNNRVLKKFRPFKNSYTKSGDKIILAKALNMPPREIPSYIKEVTAALEKTKKLDFISVEKMEMLKTYIYRHGNKDEVVAFLDYELKTAKNLTETLYSTLEYYNGGVADYFIRPIHRMDNKTLIKLYEIIHKNIKNLQDLGKYSESESEELALWALKKIYLIQNNSKLIKAIKTYRILK